MDNSTKVFNYLHDAGCCNLCCLRYLKDEDIDFSNIDEHISKKGYLSNINVIEPKRIKLNSCILCLGLLQDVVINTIVNKVLESNVVNYDTDVFTCSISIPSATLLREHSISIDLKRKFPEFYSNGVEEIPLNKAWKWLIKDKLCTKLSKTFENSNICNFFINIVTDYKENHKELQLLKGLKYNIKVEELNSRKFITNLLATVSSESYEKVIKVPPEIPNENLNFKSVECRHNSIFVAGRYCKFSRQLSQSPWIIDGVKMMTSSVEEIIFEEILNLFSVPKSNLKFSASGREDCDVRCLGKGRPFYVEFVDPKITWLKNDDFRRLENNINKSVAIKVRDLQIVPRCDLINIKEGEQKKTKDYVALCKSAVEVNDELINKINNYKEIVLQQKTPIRVLHRRPVAVRSRKIHRIEAKIIPGMENLFQLYTSTEAGTYIKEFVHGDFGRTTPNICEILGAKVDIIALDVIAINLDWPKEINYQSTILNM